MSNLRISGVGCTLMDYVYNGISFKSDNIRLFLSKKDGDGGISPGKLVFTEELEEFAGMSYRDILDNITCGKAPDAMNIGGPAVVSMIHAAQLLENRAEINFVGAVGEDESAGNLLDFLAKTPVSPDQLRHFRLPTPFTHVLSDPEYNNGYGERSFINNIGAAWKLTDPGMGFFDSDICIFGGTALVPGIHDRLDELLKKARKKGAFTVVNTVYDFRNEKENPGKPWPLGNDHSCLPDIDLLIMDLEEARKISGKKSVSEALRYFHERSVKGVVITMGTDDVLVYASGERYRKEVNRSFPVSARAILELKNKKLTHGDTTGCGDNFAGGMIYSLADQFIILGDVNPDMEEMVSWGIASGGFACFYLGGTYFENERGEKMKKVRKYLVN